MVVLYIVIGVVIILLCASIRTVRQTHRGLIERFGRYSRFAKPGLVFIVPFIERVVRVNITEMMVNSEKREIITSDSLNAVVDSNIYFKVKADETNVKASVYGVFNYQIQIVALAKTTLRNIIGTMTLRDANSKRDTINKSLYDALSKETGNWGIEIVRTELKEIVPPQSVQDVMNKVVIANNEKTAALDFATATETRADGEKRAQIKKAEGEKQFKILLAEGEKEAKITIANGEAKAIELVNTAAETYFKGNAQLLRQLQAVEASLQNNSKIVLPTGQSLVNVVGDLAGFIKPTGK
jgi:regulator of protease activity HflC (stomatin/prohibitin superfamily)